MSPEIKVTAKLASLVSELQSRIDSIDKWIEQMNSLLEYIQPMAQGKITVRFIKLSKGRLPEPVFVMWKKSIKRKSIGLLVDYDIIKTDMAVLLIKKYGPFLRINEDLRILISEIKELITKRREIKNKIGEFTRIASMHIYHLDSSLQTTATWFIDNRDTFISRHEIHLSEWKRESEKQSESLKVKYKKYVLPEDDSEFGVFIEPQNSSPPVFVRPDSD
jgi:hypothetical protein